MKNKYLIFSILFLTSCLFGQLFFAEPVLSFWDTTDSTTDDGGASWDSTTDSSTDSTTDGGASWDITTDSTTDGGASWDDTTDDGGASWDDTTDDGGASWDDTTDDGGASWDETTDDGGASWDDTTDDGGASWDDSEDETTPPVDPGIPVTPPVTPAPTVNIKANNSDGPIAIAYNTAANLTWTSTNATACTASGDWLGAKAVTGAQTTGNLIVNKIYTLTCTGAGGTATDTVTVNVGAKPADPLPTVDIKANNSDGPIAIAYNTAANLTWTSTNATACTASGDWTGVKTLTGAQTTGNLTAVKTYTLTCTGTGGTATDSVTVNVGAKPTDPLVSPAPTVDIKANNSDGPITIAYNTAANLAWTSINATACTASGDWSGAKAVAGSQTTGNLTAAKVYTYTLTCTGAGGTATDSVKINLGAKPSSGGGSFSRSSAVILSQDNLFEIEKTVGDLQAISFSDLFYVGPEEVFTFRIVVKAEKASTDEVILKDILPTGLIYHGNLKIDGKTVEGDIIAGLDLGDFSADESKVITFQVKADKADNFSFGENKLINTAEVLQADFSAMDTAQVIVLKTAVAGAATEISTGLTNNIFLDSFFLPLVLSCLILWLLKSHILRLEEWLDRRKKQYTSYRLEKTLQLKIAKIKTREFLGRIF